jgi:hypothetical protein
VEGVVVVTLLTLLVLKIDDSVRGYIARSSNRNSHPSSTRSVL